MQPETTGLTTHNTNLNYFLLNTGISALAGSVGYLYYGAPGAVAGVSVWAITAVARKIFDATLTSLTFEKACRRGVSLVAGIATGSVAGLYATQALGPVIGYAFHATPFLKALILHPTLQKTGVVAKPVLVGIGLYIATLGTMWIISNVYNKITKKPAEEAS